VPVRAWLRHATSKRFVQFGVVGFSGVWVNLGALRLFADILRLPVVVSSGLAIELSILSNFILNNTLTFRDRNARARVGFFARMFRYNLVGLVGLALQLGTFVTLAWVIASNLDGPELGVWKYPCQLAGIVLGTLWNFASNTSWTWRQLNADADHDK